MLVSEPDIRSASEAVNYLKKIHQIITYLDISDGNMSQGSMRCDANVSIMRPDSKEFGTRAEIKNINSFKFVEKAINFEVKRQIKCLEDGETVEQETRLYASIKDETRSMRTKEFANDYRYFPCPDLVPINISSELIKDISNNMDELPGEKEQRFKKVYKLDAPLGVRGRNSNNDLIREKLGWDYSQTLEEGIRKTYNWIKQQIEDRK